jgi:hypothetical protein
MAGWLSQVFRGSSLPMPRRSTMKLPTLSIITVRSESILVPYGAPDVTSYRIKQHNSVAVPLRAAI